MKIVGLIVEYNPFHNGHLYHIEESLRLTGADKVVVVMSGDFVQRGTPAIMPKHLRAQMALQCGASLVIELPVRYATGSAEYFATGAVSLLHQLGCVDYICFGSECGDIEKLSKVSNILSEEPEEFKCALQEYLKLGHTFPIARQKAMTDFLSMYSSDEVLSTILSEPNNILGVEYLKALRMLNSPIQAVTIRRNTSHYHDKALQHNYSSASSIRACIQKKDGDCQLSLKELEGQVPTTCYTLLSDSYATRYPIYPDDFSLLLHSKLMKETKESLLKFQDMSVELANRIINNRNNFTTFEEFTELIHTKNMTHARVNRILIHILLDIYKETMSPHANAYIHILGFRKGDQFILNKIKENSEIPIITKLTVQDDISIEGQEMLEQDILASNLYEIVVANKFKQPFIHELEKSLVLL